MPVDLLSGLFPHLDRAETLAAAMQPDVVILVTGDADFAYLATKLRRCGIRVEVASLAQNLGGVLRPSAKATIDLAPLFRTFELFAGSDPPAPPSRGSGRKTYKKFAALE